MKTLKINLLTLAGFSGKTAAVAACAVPVVDLLVPGGTILVLVVLGVLVVRNCLKASRSVGCV